MGVHLYLVITDGHDDTPAARLARLVDALIAWGHIDAETFAVERSSTGLPAWDKALAPGLRRAAQRAKAWLGEPIGAARTRALLGALESTCGVVLTVHCPIARLYVETTEERSRAWRFAPDRVRSVAERRAGHLHIDMHKVGRRFFEAATSDVVEQLRDELAALRGARRHAEGARLLREIGALEQRLMDERRRMMLALLEALATWFRPAAIAVRLDSRSEAAPWATMVYYRDAAAVCADLALLADADAIASVQGWGEPLESALGPAACAPRGDALRERLRTITPDDVARVADALTAWVTPLGEGMLVSNPAFDSVGAPVAPFFEALLAG
jgi:hypothetical protein